MEGFEGVGFHATGYELFWLIGTGLAFLVMLTLLFEVLADRRFIKTSNINGVREIVSKADVQRYILKVGICGLLFTAALASSIYPSPTPDGVRALIILALSGVPIFLLVLGAVDRGERTALAEYLQANPIQPSDLMNDNSTS